MGAPNAIPSRNYTVSPSPSRSERFPTPGFARLLRGKSGSRNRSQTSLSRSSPLFPSRSRSLVRSATSMDSNKDGEPSSPKVTCIGQVRIRKKNIKMVRSSSSGQKERGEREMRCCFISKSLFCSAKWCSMRLPFKGNAGYRRRNERIKLGDAIPLPLTSNAFELGEECTFHRSKLDEDDQYAESEESKTRVFVPPKNALILMRCRSAPHNRSSALSIRCVAADDDKNNRVEDEVSKRIESDHSFLSDGNHEEEDAESRCSLSRPLFLKRCNSEPGKKAARLAVPEAARCSQYARERSRQSIRNPLQLH